MTVRARFRYKCITCDKIHVGFPAMGFDAPLHYLTVPESERAERCFLNEDVCVVDRESWVFCCFFLFRVLVLFVRCVLEYPVLDSDELFCWGVWGSLKKENFQIYARDPGSTAGPFFSYFANSLDGYPGTLNLHCNVQFRGVGVRPRLTVLACEHPLYMEQEHGIGFGRALEIVRPFISWHAA
jgi:hypothetical protein